jgi:hypothetical protein
LGPNTVKTANESIKRDINLHSQCPDKPPNYHWVNEWMNDCTHRKYKEMNWAVLGIKMLEKDNGPDKWEFRVKR